MAVRDIITIPDPRLRLISKAVDAVDDDLRALMDDMLETMYDAPGVGLAAIQIGVAKRVIVADVSHDEEARAPLFIVNPQITWMSQETAVYEEGCLSIPEYFEEVERPTGCRIDYLDRDGKSVTLDCDGLLATVVQHEIDHLNGVLFIDHISKLKRDRVVKKFVKAKKRESVD